MGSCSNSGNRNTREVVPKDKLRSSGSRIYNQSAKLYVKSRDGAGNTVSTEKVQFRFCKPRILNAEKVTNQTCVEQVSCCVLPGCDPRGSLEKPCQDRANYFISDDALLTALCDGHGKDGHQIADRCFAVISRLFKERGYQTVGPAQFLENICGQCEAALLDARIEFDASVSGTTLTLFMVHQQYLYTANVGDSRGIVASKQRVEEFQPDSIHEDEEDARSLKSVRKRRTVIPNVTLFANQLTIDHKPIMKTEKDRIKRAGGRVMRMKDERGTEMGPYRVCEANSLAPGLAMSRSLGDTCGKHVGVTAEPTQNTYNLSPFQDAFCVIASDGVWDVMDNQEVTDYIQNYRQSACKGTTDRTTEQPNKITTENRSIAQLLGEEARCRWLALVED